MEAEESEREVRSVVVCTVEEEETVKLVSCAFHPVRALGSEYVRQIPFCNEAAAAAAAAAVMWCRN
jgi:hypothetical protein